MIACNIKAYLTIFHEMNFLFSLDNLILLKWQMHFSVVGDRNLVLVTVSAKSIGIGIGAEFFFPKLKLFFSQIFLIFFPFLKEYKFL